MPSECIPNMIKHFLTVFSPPAKSSFNLCRHKLIRSTEICKQRTVSNALVCNPPTWYATAQVKYQTHTFPPSPSESTSNGLLACRAQHLNYIEGGEWDSTEQGKREEEDDLSGMTLLSHKLTDIWTQRVKPKKLKRGIQRRIPPPSVHCRAPPRSLPPLSPPQISICGDE